MQNALKTSFDPTRIQKINVDNKANFRYPDECSFRLKVWVKGRLERLDLYSIKKERRELNETPREGSFVGDPFVAKKCPGCGKVDPNTVVKGVGRDAICCADCDTSISAFDVTN